MKKKIGILVGTTIVGISSIAAPMLTTAGFQDNLKNTKINVSGNDQGAGTGFIDFVENAVNWILAILGLIAVVILIYGGFQMVTASGDEGKYKKGFTIVKQAAIGLILIGVSWLIVSLIFSFVGQTADTASNSSQVNGQ